MKFLVALSFIVLSVVPSCNGDEDVLLPLPCDDQIETISSINDLDSGDGFAISSMFLDGSCLLVEVSGTGCNPDEWTAQLVTDGSVAESSPTQTVARFVFDNQMPEDSIICQALSSVLYSFDLSPYLSPEVLPSNFTVLGPDTTSMVFLIE